MTLPRGLVLGAALLLATVAGAQTTYRWQDAKTGQTVYSDQPPPAGAKRAGKMDAAERGDGAQLPYATRLAAEKFPVTLYTADNCIEACARARSLLNARGVPYAEKLLKNDEELAEFAKELGREAAVPTLFVGRQRLIGLEERAWNNLLDLAAYPQSAPYGAKPPGVLAP